LVVDGAAVIKELVENCIDAGADTLSLRISKDFQVIYVKGNGW